MPGDEITNFGTQPPHGEEKGGFGKVGKWVGTLIVLIALGGGWYWLQNTEQIVIPEDPKPQEENEVAAYFTQTLQDTFVEEVAQPIEGFEPQMFLQIYPGLLPGDFNGVEALQGVYQVQDGEIIFIEIADGPIHSAGRAISRIGMTVLFEQVMTRFDVAEPTQEDVDIVLQFLREPPTLEEGGEIEEIIEPV